MSGIIITVDGPAASGKGTLCRALATRFGLYMLDTGAIYRGFALHMATRGLNVQDEAVVCAEVAAYEAAFSPEILADPRLRSDDIGQLTSRLSALPAVRQALLALQRQLAAYPPVAARGAILDGRDTGTVVCPAAPLKFFVTASAAARAVRRTKELQERGFAVTYETVLKDLEERDARDTQRAIAPLMPHPDAVVLDTTDMTAADVLALASRKVAEAFPDLA